MSQCTKRKRWIALIIFPGLFVFLLLQGCTAADLRGGPMDFEDKRAPLGQLSPAGTYPVEMPTDVLPAEGEKTILVPDRIITGGKYGVANQYYNKARDFIAGSSGDIRFLTPVGLALDSNYLYVVDGRSKSVFKYHLRQQNVETLGYIGAELKGEPGNIYVGRNGDIYLTDPIGKQVLAYDASGNFIRSYSDAANLSQPVDVFIDEATDRLFVADGVFSRLVVFERTGAPLFAIGARGTGPGYFRAITAMLNQLDSILVLDRLEYRVQSIEYNGRYRFSFGNDYLVYPTAIAVDRFKRYYVSDRADNTIKIYYDGEMIAKFGGTGDQPGKFKLITDLAIDGDYIYVADSMNRRVQVLRILPQKDSLLGLTE